MPELVDSVAKRAESRIGTWANDKWHLERLIGVGGVAAVYAARHRNGRRVAVKVLHPELGVDASIRRRFLREGYVANRVEHPGAVVVLDDAIDGDSVMLVMELLEGETLEGRCRRNDGKLEPLEVLRIASGLLSILESAHAHDILHRDITPANIFVTKKGEIKLLDFGIARLRDAENVDHTMSVPGALGTPAFMPPEQARGLWEELDARSDLWAVGAISFRALAGRSVHQGRSPSELLLSAMTRRAPALDSIVPDVPPAIATLVDRALKKQPSDRWQDAKSFREAVDETYRELAGSPLEAARPLSVPDVEIVTPDASTDASHADGFGTTVGVTSFRSRRALVVAAAVGAGALGTLIFWPSSKEAAPAVDDPRLAATSITTPVTPTPTPEAAPLPAVGSDAGVVDAGRRRTKKPRVVGDPLGEQY
jgi:serine/threonine protein kinase